MAGRTGHQEAGKDGRFPEDQARSADLLPAELGAHEEGRIPGHAMISSLYFLLSFFSFHQALYIDDLIVCM